jgi:hypothetical protein
MHLPKLLKSLPVELARLSSAYRTEAPGDLEPYPTLPALLVGLERTGKGSTPERKALIAQLLRIHQARPHRVWSTVLLHAFTPLLKKLRKGLVGGDEDMLDEIVLEEVQHALLRVRTHDPTRIFMYFRQELRRRVFKALAKLATWEEVGIDAELEPDPRTLEEPALLGVWLKGFGTRPEQVELLATLAEHGGLLALVRRRYPGQPFTASSREYQALHKKRQRLVAKLREQLGANEHA